MTGTPDFLRERAKIVSAGGIGWVAADMEDCADVWEQSENEKGKLLLAYARDTMALQQRVKELWPLMMNAWNLLEPMDGPDVARWREEYMRIRLGGHIE